MRSNFTVDLMASSLSSPHSPRRAAARLLGALFFLLGTGVYANEGALLFGNDAQHLARGASGVASPRSAYWSYLNPASMVDLDRRIDLNWYTVFTNIQLRPRGLLGNRFDGNQESRDIFNITSGGVIWPLERGTLGVGLYIPSGTGTDYGHSRNWLSRVFQGNADRKLMYQHARLVLAYAHEFDNGWAVGFGLHGSVSRFKSDHLTLSLRPAEAGFDWDEALGAGFNVGVYKAWEKWSVGAVYASRHWSQHFEEFEDLLSHTLDTPHTFQCGVAYRVTPRVELTLDYKFLWWEEVAAYGNSVADGGFGWKNQHGLKFGVEFKATDRLRLMAGFAHSTSPITEEHAFMSALCPVTVEDHVTVGLTYAINDRHELHFAMVHGFLNMVKDSGNGDIFSFLGRGTSVGSDGNSLAFGYSYKF
ncbi:MAG: outer membrane protein transport protein [Candidatus Hydrogenedentes bacterium]|nr:outer membrane protein transport protein [Candidatus Hydrogenedentota bacterium]